MDSRLTRPSIERNQPAELLIWGIIPELKDFSVSASGQLTAQQVAIARTVSQRVQGDIMRELSVPLEMLAVVKYRDQQGRDDNIALLARGDWEGAMHLLAMRECIVRLRVKPVRRNRGTIGKIQVEYKLGPGQVQAGQLQDLCRVIAQSSDLFPPVKIQKQQRQQRGSMIIVKYHLPPFQPMQLRQALDEVGRVLLRGVSRRVPAALEVRVVPLAEMDAVDEFVQQSAWLCSVRIPAPRFTPPSTTAPLRALLEATPLFSTPPSSVNSPSSSVALGSLASPTVAGPSSSSVASGSLGPPALAVPSSSSSSSSSSSVAPVLAAPPASPRPSSSSVASGSAPSALVDSASSWTDKRKRTVTSESQAQEQEQERPPTKRSAAVGDAVTAALSTSGLLPRAPGLTDLEIARTSTEAALMTSITLALQEAEAEVERWGQQAELALRKAEFASRREASAKDARGGLKKVLENLSAFADMPAL